MLPGLLIGISLLILLGGVLDPLSRRTAGIGESIFTTPFMILLMGARLQLLDPRLEWAAGDLGAEPAPTDRPRRLPALIPALVASAVLAFTLSFDEFIITLFLIGGVRRSRCTSSPTCGTGSRRPSTRSRQCS